MVAAPGMGSYVDALLVMELWGKRSGRVGAGVAGRPGAGARGGSHHMSLPLRRPRAGGRRSWDQSLPGPQRNIWG